MGGSEILLILIVALLLFGSNKIPEIARMLGKGLREFNKATDEIKKEIKSGAKDIHDEMKDVKNEITQNTKDINDNFVI